MVIVEVSPGVTLEITSACSHVQALAAELRRSSASGELRPTRQRRATSYTPRVRPRAPL